MMAREIIYKCDKCGRVINSKRYVSITITLLAYPKNRSKKTKTVVLSKIPVGDLCEDCTNKLKDYVESAITEFKADAYE